MKDFICENEKLILFGAGKRGKEALERYGVNNVAFFCDNDTQKQGKFINGIKIISFMDMVELYCNRYIIMITIDEPCFLIGQLEKAGINEYLLFHEAAPKSIKYDGRESQKEKEQNDFLREYIKASSKIDLLEHIDDFKTIAKDALDKSREKGVLLNYDTRGQEEEGYRYGNLQVLLRYAGIQRNEGEYMPVVSHQDSLPIYSPIHRYKTAVIFSGEYYKEKIHKRAPWVPIFTVGPYIHYARTIYDEKDMNRKKEHIGTMLLAFLPHTLENAQRNFDRKKFLKQLKDIYGMQYNQIWLCAYFTDITDEVCECAEGLGIHIVSAGFRFDPLFDDRLKTMIELSDAVVCGDIGSFLAYAIYLNKPIARVDITDRTSLLEVQYSSGIERNIEKTDDCVKFENEFYQLFGEQAALNAEQKQWMDSLAGFNQVRSTEYVKEVFNICSDIWNQSNENYRDYPDAVRRTYYAYNEQNDYKKMYMLKQAVGNFLE